MAAGVGPVMRPDTGERTGPGRAARKTVSSMTKRTAESAGLARQRDSGSSSGPGHGLGRLTEEVGTDPVPSGCNRDRDLDLPRFLGGFFRGKSSSKKIIFLFTSPGGVRTSIVSSFSSFFSDIFLRMGARRLLSRKWGWGLFAGCGAGRLTILLQRAKNYDKNK